MNSHPAADKPSLPGGWIRTTFAEITESFLAQTRPQGTDRFSYVEISSVDYRTKRIGKPKSIVPAEAPSRARQRLQGGDVLISMTRPNLNAVAMVPESLHGAIGSTGFHVLRSAGVEPAWLFYLVQTTEFVQRMALLVQGALYPAVRPKDIDSVPIPLAPLAEQRRIVAEIEKQFTRLDAATAALKRVQEKLEQYRASVLKAACEGHLVTTEAELALAERRGYESGGELLARILNERRDRWETVTRTDAAEKARRKNNRRVEYQPAVGPDAAGLGTPPEGWAVASIDQLICRITSGSRDWSRYYGRGTGTFLMAQNIRLGRLDLSFRQAIDPPPMDRDRARSQVAPNDLLVTIVGANTGHFCRVPRELPDHFVCQSVALMRPVDEAIAPYLTLYMTSDENGQRQFRRHIYGAGRPHLSFDHLRMTAVLLPPLAEQARIVDEADRTLSVVDEMERVLEANLRRAGWLRQAILKRAFEGRLVPQNSNDEQASALLERIRTSRFVLMGARAPESPRKKGASLGAETVS